MKKSKNTGKEKLLTDVELELMTVLWRLGEGSVADVIGQLPETRKLAYTSVSTVLRILEQKGVLSARKQGKGHVYIPVLKKSDYEKRAVKHVVERVFDNTPVALVRQLLSTGNLEEKDLNELKTLLSQFGSQK